MGFFRKIVKLKDGEHLLIRNAIESDAAEIIKYFKRWEDKIRYKIMKIMAEVDW